MGRRGREREAGKVGGGAIELARPHGKNWICFHSSSNKQQGNSAQLRLNTFRLGGIRKWQFELWVSCYDQNICRKAQPPVLLAGVVSKGSTDHQFTHPPSLFGFKFLYKLAQKAKKEYRSWWKRKIGSEFATCKLAQTTSRLHPILVCPNATVNVKKSPC